MPSVPCVIWVMCAGDAEDPGGRPEPGAGEGAEWNQESGGDSPAGEGPVACGASDSLSLLVVCVCHPSLYEGATEG